jgi:hypothetical protein
MKNAILSAVVAIVLAFTGSYVGLQVFKGSTETRLGSIEGKLAGLQGRRDSYVLLNRDVEYLNKFANATTLHLKDVNEKVAKLELDNARTTIAIENLAAAVKDLAVSVNLSTVAIIRLEEKINK